jgi:hypothetical protein
MGTGEHYKTVEQLILNLYVFTGKCYEYHPANLAKMIAVALNTESAGKSEDSIEYLKKIKFELALNKEIVSFLLETNGLDPKNLFPFD